MSRELLEMIKFIISMYAYPVACSDFDKSLAHRAQNLEQITILSNEMNKHLNWDSSHEQVEIPRVLLLSLLEFLAVFRTLFTSSWHPNNCSNQLVFRWKCGWDTNHVRSLSTESPALAWNRYFRFNKLRFLPISINLILKYLTRLRNEV